MTNRKKTAIIIVTCVFLLLGFFSILTIPFGENIIRSTIERRISSVLGAEIKIGSFETNLISRIRIGDISLSEKKTAGEDSILSLGHLSIEYRMWHLISRKPFVDQFLIEGLHITVVHDSSGFHLPIPRRKKQQNKSQKTLNSIFQLTQLNINNSSVTYNDNTIPLFVSAGNIRLNMKKDSESDFILQLSADEWKIKYHEKPVAVDNVILSGTVSPDELFIEYLDFSLPGLQWHLQSKVNIAESPLQINGTAEIRGNISPMAEILQMDLPGILFPLKGELETTLSFSGPIDNPEMSVLLGIENAEINKTIIDTISIDGTYRNKSLNVRDISLELLGGTVSGTGEIFADSLLTHAFSLEAHAVNFERIWELIYDDVSPYKGRINGFIETSGPLKKPRNIQADAGLSFENVILKNRPLENFNTDISFKDGFLDLTFTQSTTELDAGIKFVKDEIMGSFRFHTSKPEGLTGFANIFDLNGSLDVEGEISGTVKNPSLITNISGSGIRFHGFPLDSLNGKVIYENNTLSLDECAFSGIIESAEALAAPFKIPGLNGGLQYSGNLNGPLSNPECRIDLQITRPSYKTFILDSFNGTLHISDRKIIFNNALIEKDSLAVEIQGAYTIASSSGEVSLAFLKRTENGSLEADKPIVKEISTTDESSSGRMNLTFATADSGNVLFNAVGNDLNIERISQIYSDSLQISGLLDFEINFTGSLKYPSGSLGFYVEAPEINGVPLDSIDSHIRFDSDSFSIDRLEMYLNNQRTIADAEIELKRSQRGYPAVTGQSAIRGSAEGENISIQLLNLFKPPEMRLTGDSAYNLEFQGTIGQPKILGEVDITGAELQFKTDTPPIQNLSIHAVIRDSVLIIDPAEGTINGEHVTVNGTVATNDWERFRTEATVRVSDITVIESSGIVSADILDYEVTLSDFNLSAMQTMISDYENLNGNASAVLNLTGSLQEPELSGDLTISDVSFVSPLREVPVSRGYAFLRFDRNTVHIDSLSADVNTGTLLMFGTVVHNNGALSELDLNAKLHNIMIKRQKEYTI
ncbi:hypothetical protein ACFL2X_07460, partial [Candidatus Latescibacterota bacterium]